jgi:hypothetical protein
MMDLNELERQVEEGIKMAGPNQSACGYIELGKLRMLIRMAKRSSEFYIHGSDGCKNCEHGRVTLWTKSNWCVDCRTRSGLEAPRARN